MSFLQTLSFVALKDLPLFSIVSGPIQLGLFICLTTLLGVGCRLIGPKVYQTAVGAVTTGLTSLHVEVISPHTTFNSSFLVRAKSLAMARTP